MFITSCRYTNKDGNTEFVTIAAENIMSFSAGKNLNAEKKAVFAHMKNGRTVPLCLCECLDEADNFISYLLHVIKETMSRPDGYSCEARYFDEIDCDDIIRRVRGETV